MTDFIISREASDYLSRKRRDRRHPNIVIYRNVSGIILGYTTMPVRFTPRVKMMYDEPNEMFSLVGTSNGIPIWVERALLPWAAMFRSVTIALGGRVFAKLKLDLVPDLPDPSASPEILRNRRYEHSYSRHFY
jgi:hypothetical protein